MTKQENSVKEPVAAYARNTEIPTFFGEPMLRGAFIETDGMTDPDAHNVIRAVGDRPGVAKPL